MSRRKISRPLIPNPSNTLDDHERFTHRDVGRLDPRQVAAEITLLELRCAELLFNADHGAFITVVDGECVYESDWIVDRLRRLRTRTTRRAA